MSDAEKMKNKELTGYEIYGEAQLFWWEARAKQVGNYKFAEVVNKTLTNKSEADSASVALKKENQL